MDELQNVLAKLELSNLSDEEIAELKECMLRIGAIIDNLNDMQKWLDKYGL